MKIVIIYSANIKLNDFPLWNTKDDIQKNGSRCSFPFNKIKAAEVQRCIISTFCYFHKKYDTEVYQMCTIALRDKQNKMYVAICSKLPLCCRSTISFNFFFIFL